MGKKSREKRQRRQQGPEQPLHGPLPHLLWVWVPLSQVSWAEMMSRLEEANLSPTLAFRSSQDEAVEPEFGCYYFRLTSSLKMREQRRRLMEFCALFQGDTDKADPLFPHPALVYQEFCQQPLPYQPSDDTAPWTHKDRAFFKAHPDVDYGVRPLCEGELDDLRSRDEGGFLALYEQSFPGELAVVVVRLNTGRARMLCVFRDKGIYVIQTDVVDEGVPVVPLDEQGHPRLVLQSNEDIQALCLRGSEALHPTSPEGLYHLDFCEVCGQEILEAGIEFHFGQSQRPTCGDCARDRLGRDTMRGVGFRAPEQPPDESSPEVKKRWEQTLAVIRAFQPLLSQDLGNHARRQAAKRLLTMAKPSRPH